MVRSGITVPTVPQNFPSARQNARSGHGERLLEWAMHSASTPSIHGHEVLDAMQASGRLFTRESLARFIRERFGAESRFHTCSAEGMTATELVNFLAERGKFVGTEEGFTLNPARVCQH